MKCFVKIVVIAIASMSLLGACDSKKDLAEEKFNLLETDKAFSKRSAETGNFQAFLEYAQPDAVLLKANSVPIIGRNTIENYFAMGSDSTYVLTWEPKYADVSASADLGYTYGIYQLRFISGPQKDEIAKGTYTTIWRKTPKGTWRFVLDTGNEGLGQ